MDKKRMLAAATAAVAAFTIFTAGGTSPQTAIDIAQQTAFLAAGIKLPENKEALTALQIKSSDEAAPQETEDPPQEHEQPSDKPEDTGAVDIATTPATVELPVITAPDADGAAPEAASRVISQNITEFDDELDYTAEGIKSGIIYRKHYSGYQGDEYITLPGGGLVWNCTSDSAEALAQAAEELPELNIEFNSEEPQVLIVHTHTTESYEPYQRSYYDSSFPFRTRDPSHNMVRVGEVLAQRLAEHGISVLHDGTVHDYPAYTGAYDRSEATIRAALEQYPSIRVIIDLHRDAIANPDGSRTAPVAEINGKSAAQFMIIAGCDDGRFGNMPEYMENFRLACLIQSSAEALYPGLARPILFDYRNYNQHISTGSLLIEIGSHANSLDEAVYSAELLGDSIAKALEQLAAE